MSLRSALPPSRRRVVVAASSALALAGAAVFVTAAPARADVFSNPAPIAIPDMGQGDPYPSSISVSGLHGGVTDVNVTLTALSHTFPDDIDILLVGPGGQSVVLMADTGGMFEIDAISLTFDDAAAAPLPDEDQIVEGTFKPTIGTECITECGFEGTPPAPAGPYGTTLGAFNGTQANGTWKLFVFDSDEGDIGYLAGGWSIDIAASGPAITSFEPASGPPGTSVVITGTDLAGATSVTFGGVDANFTQDSRTQITARVPNRAETGPIVVTTPSGTATSSEDFTVGSLDHEREVTLRLGGRARGSVSVPDGFSACAAHVPVKVQLRRAGSWRLVGTDESEAGGGFVVDGTIGSGRYRALAKKVTLPSGDVCLKAVSPVVSS